MEEAQLAHICCSGRQGGGSSVSSYLLFPVDWAEEPQLALIEYALWAPVCTEIKTYNIIL